MCLLKVVVTYYDNTPAANTKVQITEDGYTEVGMTDQHGHFYKELLRPTQIKVSTRSTGN